MDEKAADENLVELSQEWLTAFEAVQAATGEEEAVARWSRNPLVVRFGCYCGRVG
jgi:hypothetical protein